MKYVAIAALFLLSFVSIANADCGVQRVQTVRQVQHHNNVQLVVANNHHHAQNVQFVQADHYVAPVEIERVIVNVPVYEERLVEYVEVPKIQKVETVRVQQVQKVQAVQKVRVERVERPRLEFSRSVTREVNISR